MPGNHSRLSAKKEASLKGENIDNLLIPYLAAVLQNVSNIHCQKNNVDESIAIFNVRGYMAYAVHGDKDTPNNVVQNLTMQYGVCPKFVFMGHRHKNSMDTVYNTKVISAGCWSGVDNYAIDKRFNTRAEPVLSVTDANGLVCNYDIALN
jgi:predicted metal-dependent phosphotriesterase family hydrolase